MNKKARVTVYEHDAVRISAYLKDFAGITSEWKIAVYEMFRWQMTWGFAYKIDVIESNDSGVFLTMLIKPAFEKSVLETMENYGFTNIISLPDSIGTIECTDLPNDMLIDFAVVD